MREKLVNYVDLLFAGAENAQDMKQEILQNTLDRYDDLIAQGKSPEAAYRLSISGIGDINEILGTQQQKPQAPASPASSHATDPNKRLRTAVAVAMYILCPIPLIVLDSVGAELIGLSIMFILIAGATALLIMNKEDKPEDDDKGEPVSPAGPQGELRKSIKSAIFAAGLVLYFALSILTQAWYITWIIFLLIGPVEGLVLACLDFKEAADHEN